MADLAERLARRIMASGPITVADYIDAANAHYYATRDPFGAAGDFVTAPEISQMFGELVGLWLADLWRRAGQPPVVRYVELGPGRGTLAVDALRAMRRTGLTPCVELLEASPRLRRAQSERLPKARWHDSLDGLPTDAPLLIVANEFFDALPVRQLVATDRGWRERMVDFAEGGFVPVLAQVAVNDIAALPDASPGTVVEVAPLAVAIVRGLAARLAAQGGVAVIVDYGHDGGGGDTLQAVAHHRFADPWAAPGTRDLTTHVDFAALANAARGSGVRIFGPRNQGEWLESLGIGARAAALAAGAPARAAEIEAARRRLTAPNAMGTLFKVMALVAPDWPDPADLV